MWFDEFSLQVGDSLRRAIDQGLAHSRFGIVILSPDFFEKQWPQWELDGLVVRQNSEPQNVFCRYGTGLTRRKLGPTPRR